MLWKLPEIRIAPEEVFNLWGFSVTNTLICTWVSIILLIVLFYFGTRRRNLVPAGLQNGLEWVVEFLLGLVQSVSGKEKGKQFFPLVATFFIFIVTCNLLDVIPGVDTIGTIKSEEIAKMHTSSQPVHLVGPIYLLFGDISNQIIPWIRPATTDLNLTLAMAVVSVVVTQIFGFIALGPKEHLSKYFNFKALFTGGPTGIVEFFLGILEIVSETARIISFSFRLFGNIFAGSALLAVFAFLLPVVAAILFIPFELFVAVVQALVFALLTLVFLEIATTSHAHAESEYEAVKHYEQKKEQHEQQTVAAH